MDKMPIAACQPGLVGNKCASWRWHAIRDLTCAREHEEWRYWVPCRFACLFLARSSTKVIMSLGKL
jgi:hypothetical protein